MGHRLFFATNGLGSRRYRRNAKQLGARGLDATELRIAALTAEAIRVAALRDVAQVTESPNFFFPYRSPTHHIHTQLQRGLCHRM